MEIMMKPTPNLELFPMMRNATQDGILVWDTDIDKCSRYINVWFNAKFALRPSECPEYLEYLQNFEKFFEDFEDYRYGRFRYYTWNHRPRLLWSERKKKQECVIVFFENGFAFNRFFAKKYSDRGLYNNVSNDLYAVGSIEYYKMVEMLCQFYEKPNDFFQITERYFKSSSLDHFIGQYKNIIQEGYCDTYSLYDDDIRQLLVLLKKANVGDIQWKRKISKHQMRLLYSEITDDELGTIPVIIRNLSIPANPYWKQTKIPSLITQISFNNRAWISFCAGTEGYRILEEIQNHYYASETLKCGIINFHNRLKSLGFYDRVRDHVDHYQYYLDEYNFESQFLNTIFEMTKSCILQWKKKLSKEERVYVCHLPTKKNKQNDICIRQYYVKCENQIGADPLLCSIEIDGCRLFAMLGTEHGKYIYNIIRHIEEM